MSGKIRGGQIKDESITDSDLSPNSVKASEMSPEAISEQDEITVVDATNDKLLIWDNTDSELKKVAPTNLGIGGVGSSMTIVGREMDDTDITVSSTTQITFDWTTGLFVEPDGANQVKIKLGSHFNPITVDGQTSVEADGESSLEFKAGDNVSITTDNATNAKSIKFHALPDNEMTLGASDPLDKFVIKQNSTGTELFEFFDSGDVMFAEATQFTLRSTSDSPKIKFQHGNPGVDKGFIGIDHQDSHKLKIGPAGDFSNSAITIDSSGEITQLGQDAPVDGEVLTWDNTNTKVVWAAAASGGGSPAGSNGELQYNDNGSFGGDADLTWDASNSRLGIGTTSPSQMLHVKNENGAATIRVHGGDGDGNINIKGGDGNSAWIYQPIDTKELRFYTEEDGSDKGDRMTILGTGDVGIGTTSPLAKLHVCGEITTKPGSYDTPTMILENDDDDIRLQFFGEGTGQEINFGYSNSATACQIYTVPGSSIKLKVDGTTRLTAADDGVYMPNGNVGVGTSTPFTKLDVTRTISSIAESTINSECNLLVRNITDGVGAAIGFSAGWELDGVTPVEQTSASVCGAAIVFTDDAEFKGVGDLEFKTRGNGGGRTRLKIDKNGKVGVGYNSTTHSDIIRGASSQDCGTFSIHSDVLATVEANDGPELNFSRHMGYTVSPGENLGEIAFWGSRDNSTYDRSAQVIVESSTSWGADQAPARMKFYIAGTDETNASTMMLEMHATHTDSEGATAPMVGINHNPVHNESAMFTVAGKMEYDGTETYGSEYTGCLIDFKNTGGTSLHRGLSIWAGNNTVDSSNDAIWLQLCSGDGTPEVKVHYSSVTGGQFSHWSDERLKSEIAPTQVNALDIFSKIEMKEFVTTFNGKTKPKQKIGFIAQNIESLIPEMVSEDDVRGYDFKVKSVGPSTLLPYMTKAIQELIEKNEELEARLAVIESSSQ